jgi:hypothetical protein
MNPPQNGEVLKAGQSATHDSGALISNSGTAVSLDQSAANGLKNV